MAGMKKFGLLGLNISYSRSPQIWKQIWEESGVDDSSFELVDTHDWVSFLKQFRDDPSWKGLMVTTPYKERVLPYLDGVNATASSVGAVNVIAKVNGKLIGYNTDVIGFFAPLRGLEIGTQAIVLGSGGGSKAVQYALKAIGVTPIVISRTPSGTTKGYSDLNHLLLSQVRLIVNATPLGGPKHPCTPPPIPYSDLSSSHILYDLSYAQSLAFFDMAPDRCTKINGEQMLWCQAREANKIFLYHG